MTHPTTFTLRHRDGELRYGFANDYPKHAGWRDVVGVPPSVKYGCRLSYNPAIAERDAIRAIKSKVRAGIDSPAVRRHNADLYWTALERAYDDLGVHPTYRKSRAQ